jgi:hypothetical protein
VNVAGVLSASDYDRRVPDGWKTRDLLPSARAAVVLGTGGRTFFRAFQAAHRGEGPGDAFAPGARDCDPLDSFLTRVVEEAARDERSRGGQAAAAYAHERRRGGGVGAARFADFVELAAAAGLGAPSRLALLVHREFGPWLGIRAVLLLARSLPPTRPDPDFTPCTGCPAPCETACPGAAVPSRGFDLACCTATTAREPTCRVGCAARRACVVGPEHRYSEDAEAWHRRAAVEHLSLEKAPGSPGDPA